MTESHQNPETQNIPVFKEIPSAATNPPWCVDGRPDFTKPKGPQMLGASLHPLVLYALQTNGLIDNQTINRLLADLKNQGFPLGAHRDNHHHQEGKCGCGFSDRLPEIIKTAQSQRQKITRRLAKLGFANIDDVYNIISAYNLDKIKASGETLVALVEKNGGLMANLEGDHQEAVAFINLKSDTTLDTNGLNRQNQQAFNLDLWSVTQQAKALGVSEDFTRIASLILYQATEIVLVEDKGKPALPVKIHQ